MFSPVACSDMRKQKLRKQKLGNRERKLRVGGGRQRCCWLRREERKLRERLCDPGREMEIPAGSHSSPYSQLPLFQVLLQFVLMLKTSSHLLKVVQAGLRRAQVDIRINRSFSIVNHRAVHHIKHKQFL